LCKLELWECNIKTFEVEFLFGLV